ncbi:MAG: trypsin-like peptidase domain-containing protein [bacterium]|nr:trypsin-like peptidase domain-containing protein [bacterium]
MNSPYKVLAVLVIISLFSGVAGGMIGNRYLGSPVGSGDGSTVVQPVQLKLTDEASPVIEAIQKVSPSVVSIVITQDLRLAQRNQVSPFELFGGDPFFDQFFGPQTQPQQPQQQPKDDKPVKQKVGGGSGFILSKDGLILTNRHVVARDDADYTVLLKDGGEYAAEVVSRDLFNDIAVIKLKPKDGETLPELKPVRLGSSSELQIGQTVIAIGNALAEFQNSATKGIISAIGRQIVASDGTGRGQNLSGLIQTDAAINPGNSGGPLVNLAGEVVGINTAIAANAQGIGFAIPIDDVKPVIASVEEHGRIVRPILGVMFTMLTPELAKELELGIEEGALLKGDGQNFAVLPGKPAEKAGLLEKDVILKINGNKITEANPLQREIMKYSPGDKIKVTYWRKGKELETEVTLEEAPRAESSGEAREKK